jgi:hypothetical protein
VKTKDLTVHLEACSLSRVENFNASNSAAQTVRAGCQLHTHPRVSRHNFINSVCQPSGLGSSTTLDGCVKSSILHDASCNKQNSANEDSNAREERQCEIPILLSQSATDWHIGHRTIPWSVRLTLAEAVNILRQSCRSGDCPDRQTNCRGSGKLGSARLLERKNTLRCVSMTADQ